MGKKRDNKSDSIALGTTIASTGSITGAIWKLSWPVMLGMIVQTFMGIVDIFFVNRLGVDQAAAVIVSDSIFGVLFVFSSLISIGSLSIISRYVGSGDFRKLKMLSAQSVFYTVLISIAITAFSLLSLDIVLGLFSLTPVVTQYAKEYLVIRLLGIVFAFLNETFRSMIHGLGDSYTPMKILIISNIINIILTPALMFGFFFIPAMGVFGAALATVIAIVFASIVLYFRYLYSFGLMRTRVFLGYMKFQWSNLKSILNIGVFSTVSNITRPFTGMIMYKIASMHSIHAVAAFGNGGRLLGLMFIILNGLQVACSVLVGQSTGAGRQGDVSRVVKESLKVALLNVLAFGLLFLIFPSALLWLFTGDPLVISIGSDYLRIVYVGVIFCAFTTVFGGYFIGIGYTKPSMAASLIANYLVKLPIAFLFIVMLGMSLTWLWYAISISILVEAFVVSYWYIKKRNLYKKGKLPAISCLRSG